MSNTKFKTTIKCMSCVAKVTPVLDKMLGSGNWWVDLQDPDRVLSTLVDTDPDMIIEALDKVGYKAESIVLH